MVGRAKKRTHAGAKSKSASQPVEKSMERSPKSMVIRTGAGDVGPSVSQLAKDFRKMMEPGTASRLQERKANKLRDYTTMTGPLGVTHMILFSRSETGNTNMRIAITPHGPTLHFRVDNYSLCKDIMRAMRHPRNDKNAFMNPPLLVLNNFLNAQPDKSQPVTSESKTAAQSPITKQLEQLCTTVFQSLFPPLRPQETPLSGIKRVLLLNREPPGSRNPDRPLTDGGSAADPAAEEDHSLGPAAYALSLRHYAITTRRVGLSRAMKRLKTAERRPARLGSGPTSQGGFSSGSGSGSGSGAAGRPQKGRTLPNLGKLEDISEWVLNADDPSAMGYTSASESEADTEAEVEVSMQEKQTLGKRSRRAANKDSDPANKDDGDGEEESGESESDGDGDAAAAARPPQARSRVEKRAVKLVELGPRMRLRLIKIEEGLCSGKVMWHEYIHKSPEEKKAQEKAWEKRDKLREERRKTQRDNVERKKQEKAAQRAKSKGEHKDDEDGDDDYDYGNIDDLDDEDLDDLNWQTDDDEDADQLSDEDMD